MMTMSTAASTVLSISPASPEEAHRFFAAKLGLETDPSDVHHDLTQGNHTGFLLIDVRSAANHAQCHLPGAVSLPHRVISHETTAGFSKEQLLVVYCWGPACNAATRAAAKLSALGFQVKEMIGGIEYWRKEGFEVEGEDVANAPLVG